MQVLNLLFAANIRNITFNAPSFFAELRVFRYTPKENKQQLLIAGSSTYSNIRLNNWEASRQKKHTCIIGHEGGVRIQVEGLSDLPDWNRARSKLDQRQQSVIEESFAKIRQANGNWDAIKNPVAAILSLLVGSAKFAAGISATASGFHVKYAFGAHALEIGMAGAKVTAVATAAGPAVVLGIAAATAVYYIPWPSLASFMERALWFMWEKIKDVWSTFLTWVRKLVGDQRPRTTCF
jgi:hypothetical protein